MVFGFPQLYQFCLSAAVASSLSHHCSFWMGVKKTRERTEVGKPQSSVCSRTTHLYSYTRIRPMNKKRDAEASFDLDNSKDSSWEAEVTLDRTLAPMLVNLSIRLSRLCLLSATKLDHLCVKTGPLKDTGAPRGAGWISSSSSSCLLLPTLSDFSCLIWQFNRANSH